MKMLTWPELRNAVKKIVTEHPALLIYSSLLLLSTIGFLNYELKYNQKDLLFWTRELRELHSEYKSLLAIMIVAILLANIIGLVFVVVINWKYVKLYRELTVLEFRRNYADFTFKKFMTHISRIENQLRSQGQNPSPEFYQAKKDIEKKIAEFKKDTRRLINPTGFNVFLPTDQIFDCPVFDELDRRSKNFYAED